jgi:Terminase large subunit, T4likevirus-type, N-terminal
MTTPSLGPSDYLLHTCQLEVFLCPARFRVLVAGRRFGKTHLALIELLHDAAKGPGRLGWYVGPNDRHARLIAWDRLKELTRPYWKGKPNETDHRIDLLWGSTIVVVGAFNPDSLRGVGLNFVVIDEAASTKETAWSQVLRLALADRKGRALFIGTPKGRNHFYRLYQHALIDPDWAAFHFTTAQGEVVSKSELASAARDLDSEVHRQELDAEFTAIGHHLAYSGFGKDNIQRVHFDGLYPLIWALDFNVDPMCALLIQQIGEIVHVLEEIVIRPNANTYMACDKFLQRADLFHPQVSYLQLPMVVKLYGDATGAQQHTSAGSQTDWSIIKDFFTKYRGKYAPQYFYATANPFVYDRVHCVNVRLRNHAGDVRVLIDPSCKELIRDLEEVTWALDSVGARTRELNKKDPTRTHASDALGYFISQHFPMKGKIGEKSDGPLW